MATTADIRKGLAMELEGKLYLVVDFQHVKPGKGGAFVRTKLKSLENGRTIDKTFNSGASINPVRIERRPYQFVYKDDMGYNFMHMETFEQIAIPEDVIDGRKGPYIRYDEEIMDIVKNNEPHIALYAKDDGLYFYKKINLDK